jgi:hypothetical protein
MNWHRFLLLAVLLGVAGCRCNGGSVEPGELGFRVETTELDFGRVLEGDEAVLKAKVVGTGRIDVDVTLATEDPFSCPASIKVPGGSTFEIEVKFHAGSTVVEKELKLTTAGGTTKVKLKGTGVRPKVCTPSAPCRLSAYSLELDACVESVAAEGSDCQPTSVCLEKGECRQGLCQGVARTCDDKDACTNDSCSNEHGCVNVTRTCPAPTAVCRVATCDSTTGCGSAVAPDGTPCGSVDCVNAHLCVASFCVVVPTPEGFVCGPPTPCQGEAHCHNQVCVSPDAGVMMPKTVVRLTGAPVDQRPALLVQNGNVFFQMCGLPPAPPVEVDGGTDGGSDGGSDGGADGGDAGVDAGPDGGPFGDGGFCGLVSYTGTGFERWTALYDDPAPRALIQVSALGTVLLRPGALELHLLSSGTPTVLPLNGEAVPRGIAQGAAAELWAVVAGDGGNRLMRWSDAGALPSVDLDGGGSLLTVDEQGTGWIYSPEAGTLASLQPTDAGWVFGRRDAGGGVASLTATAGAVLAGARHLVFPADAGFVSFTWLSDAGAPLEMLERPVVMGEGQGFVFFKECVTPVMSCPELEKATWVQAFSLTDGQLLWKAKVLPEGAPGRVEEVALVGLQSNAIGALVQESFDGGAQAFLQAFAEGKRVLLCPFAEGTVFGGAVFTTGSLHALVSRDAGWLLETYDLGPAPVLSTGWPQADGIGGTRHAR